jgi:predicted lipid-binding transport protein (Tim44 family)
MPHLVSPFRYLALAALAATMALAFFAEAADARVGGGRSLGSRGSNTYSAPPATNTAPKPAAPIERSMTQPGKSTAAAPAAQAGKAATSTAASQSRFGGMFKGLLLGGLMAAAFAGIFGAGALASVLGFILQSALIAGLIFLIIGFFRSRSGQPAMAQAGAGSVPRHPHQNAVYRTAMPAGGAGQAAIQIGPDDYNAFERLLGEIQDAYGRQEQNALGDRVTPEMLSYFAHDLAEDARQGVRNEVKFGKLLQGDLSEAWSEPDGEYATVAMRYSITDAKVEIATGRVVEGSRTEPQEVTEVWTFRRPRGGRPDQWELSAIQQA